jgi:hypothetical protein
MPGLVYSQFMNFALFKPSLARDTVRFSVSTSTSKRRGRWYRHQQESGTDGPSIDMKGEDFARFSVSTTDLSGRCRSHSELDHDI